MATIVPTITTADINEFNANLENFKTFTKRVQIDMSDGTFTPTQMVPLANMTLPPDLKIDLHMMTAKPSRYLQNILALKPSMVIMHAEVDDDLPGVIQQLRAANIRVGIALLKGTFPRRVQALINSVDHVMIFAGTLGAQGGAIDMLQIEKIPLIKAIKPDLEIGWDGGANLSNVRALAHAGVDIINVGSAISKAADRAAMYESLVAECEKKGVLI